jgi:hypothetical protein
VSRQKRVVVSREALEELKVMVDTMLLTLEPAEKRLAVLSLRGYTAPWRRPSASQALSMLCSGTIRAVACQDRIPPHRLAQEAPAGACTWGRERGGALTDR